MACEDCQSVTERFDVPHVIRKCRGCGRELHLAEPGEHGRGFRVEVGDRFVIPEGWIRLSLDPLKATVRLSEAGLEMVAKMMFVKGLPKDREGFEAAAKELEDYADKVVMESPLTKGLDINSANDVEAILDVLTAKGKDTAAWWALWLGQFLVMSRDARTANDALGAAWAQAWAERMRWMLIYKEQLEAAVVMGHSARRLVDTLAIWDGNRKTDDEEFWQLTFNENNYVLSQVFAVPVVFIQDKAYVGGMKIGREEARFVDYLFSAESSQEAILVEIKTPATRLLGGEYRRGVFGPSAELSGSIAQVLNYRTELVAHLRHITAGDPNLSKLTTFSPRCVVIAGNAHEQLTSSDQRRSFELYRHSLKDVEVITYDELFRKVEVLAQLFRLKRASS